MDNKRPDQFADAMDQLAAALGAEEAKRNACLALAVKTLEDIANAAEGSHAHHLRTMANGALVQIAVRATK